ncbi:hypothetical protein QYF36_009254 [Acer negundo]|nr:hypothetical protein QYF36_009254 [Acer negundo]
MRAYAARGETGVTRHVFDEIIDKNIVFINVMIRSYANNHFFSDALLMFKTMSSCGFEPDNYTYPCLLKACSGIRMVSMFGKCGSLVEARRVLNEMPSRDVVSWNSMVSGYVQSGRFDDMLEVCREMESLRLKPDIVTALSQALYYPAGINDLIFLIISSW